MELMTTFKGKRNVNPVVLIRQLLDEHNLEYDSLSFDLTELYCYRHNIEASCVMQGKLIDIIQQLLVNFEGALWITNKAELKLLTKGQTICDIDEIIVDSERCDHCLYYRFPEKSCKTYRGSNA